MTNKHQAVVGKKLILCVSHVEKVAYESEIVRPILVGHNIPLPKGWFSDNKGQNISDKNKNYSELTAIYWAWMNLPLDEYEYIGLFHYRRLLGVKCAEVDLKSLRSGLDVDKYIDDDSIDRLMLDYDVVLPMPLNFGDESIAERYVTDHIESDFGALIAVLIDKHPEKYHSILRFFYGNKPGLYYPFNMFIMKSNIFRKYANWLFDILFEVERRIRISPDVYQARVFGFMSERLMALFFTVFYSDIKLRTVPFVIQDKNNKLWVNVLYSSSILPNRIGTDGIDPNLKARNREDLWYAKISDRGPSIAAVIRGPTVREERSRELNDQTREGLALQTVSVDEMHVHNGSCAELLGLLRDECTAEWVLFLTIGDVLEPSAIGRIKCSLQCHPEWGLVYFDEGQDKEGGDVTDWHYKPDFNLDYFRSMPYVGSCIAMRRDLFINLGGFDYNSRGIEEYALALRTFEWGGGASIGHVPGLRVKRACEVSLAERPLSEILEAGRCALKNHLNRIGIQASVRLGDIPATFRVLYEHAQQPMVSVVVISRNKRKEVQRCLESLFGKTRWPNYEVIIVDLGSDEADTVEFIHGLESLGKDLDGRIRVLFRSWDESIGDIRRVATCAALGEYVLFLTESAVLLHDEWLSSMMRHAMRPEVAVVGAKLLKADGSVRNAGYILGMGGVAGCPFEGYDAKSAGYYGRLQVDQGYSAVSDDCLLIRKSVFNEVSNGPNDEDFGVWSGVDLCLRVKTLGFEVVWTPHALICCDNDDDIGATQGASADISGQENLLLVGLAEERMYRKWLPIMANDPAYNRCLTIVKKTIEVEESEALTWDPAWRPVPRVIAQPADRMGCGEYRIIAPARALMNSGKVQGLETDRIYLPPELERIKPDSLVVQRQLEPFQISAIERHKRLNDVFCVFELDDLVTNLPTRSAHRPHMPKNIYKRLRRVVGVCDRMVVATEELADAYSGLTGDIRVVPNFLERERWEGLAPKRRTTKKPRVGWAGGVSHGGDLQILLGVVEALKDEVDWVFFGMCPDALRPFVKEVHDPVPIDHYANRLANLNLDLAIAPLEDVPFNRAKSHLKLLEYGVLGYPVVCSDVAAYRGNFPVTRVRNRFADWMDAIKGHIDDLDSAARRGNELQDYIRKHWWLEDNLDIWMKAWLP